MRWRDRHGNLVERIVVPSTGYHCPTCGWEPMPGLLVEPGRSVCVPCGALLVQREKV